MSPIPENQAADPSLQLRLNGGGKERDGFSSGMIVSTIVRSSTSNVSTRRSTLVSDRSSCLTPGGSPSNWAIMSLKTPRDIAEFNRLARWSSRSWRISKTFRNRSSNCRRRGSSWLVGLLIVENLGLGDPVKLRARLLAHQANTLTAEQQEIEPTVGESLVLNDPTQTTHPQDRYGLWPQRPCGRLARPGPWSPTGRSRAHPRSVDDTGARRCAGEAMRVGRGRGWATETTGIGCQNHCKSKLISIFWYKILAGVWLAANRCMSSGAIAGHSRPTHQHEPGTPNECKTPDSLANSIGADHIVFLSDSSTSRERATLSAITSRPRL